MTFEKSCLFIAPTTDLYYAPKEAETVVNLLHANLLNGQVTIEDLVNRVRRTQPKLIIISSHGSTDGILLSDGVVGADLLKPIFSTTDIECVYLNTCESIETAWKIHGELPTALISTIMPVPDKLAYVTMSAFAHHLASGSSYADAWIKSRSAGNRNFVFFPSSSDYQFDGPESMSTTPQRTPVDRPTKRNGDGGIADLHEEVSRLSYLIYGNPQWNLTGILPTITQLQRECRQVRLLLLLLATLAALLIAVAVGRYLPL